MFFFSLSYLFQFAAYNGLTNLQTSINSSDNLGLNSMITISLSFSLTCLYLPPLFYKWMNGFKWPLVISHAFLSVFVLANFYPSNYTLIPASILGGAAMGLLWTYQGNYIIYLYTLKLWKQIHIVIVILPQYTIKNFKKLFFLIKCYFLKFQILIF